MPPRSLTRVTLPLVARHGPRFAVAALGATGMALACLALALMLARSDGDTPSRYAFAAMFVAAALVPAAVAVTAVRDMLAGGRVLVVDPDGVTDTRLGTARIGWDEVRAASIVGAANGIAAVRLTLADEGAPLYNPFRIGGWSAEWGHRRRDRLVALTLLDRRAHDLAHTMVALAARHGARVEQTPAP